MEKLNLTHNQNLVCSNWEAAPITDLLDLDHRTSDKIDNMKKAMALYLNKPACNHIEFSNNKPKMALLKISDFYKCTEEIQESVWLVAGPNRDDKCLVSWASL